MAIRSLPVGPRCTIITGRSSIGVVTPPAAPCDGPVSSLRTTAPTTTAITSRPAIVGITRVQNRRSRGSRAVFGAVRAREEGARRAFGARVGFGAGRDEVRRSRRLADDATLTASGSGMAGAGGGVGAGTGATSGTAAATGATGGTTGAGARTGVGDGAASVDASVATATG